MKPEVTLASDEPELTAPGESTESSTRTFPEHRRLGHYLLLDVLGRGGMGVVYAAHDTKLDRKVAIKMLRSEGHASLQRRLIREAKAMAKLAHPNVVTVHEIGEHEGTAFLVMEYVEGQTLRQWLAATPRSVDETQLAWVESTRNLGRLMVRSLSDGSEHEVTRANDLNHIVWSPDGQTIAFIAQYRGQAHVSTVPVAGGTPMVFKRAFASSDDPPLAWAPSEWILYERPENRNFGVLDPQTEADRPLIPDDTVGWPFYPAVSPDGDSVAVLWSRDPLGVWIIDIEQGTERLLIEGEYYPIRWSNDGRFIYASGRDTAVLFRIPTEQPAGEGSGPPEPWRTIDFGPRRTGHCNVSSTEALLCEVVESTSDIWISDAIE